MSDTRLPVARPTANGEMLDRVQQLRLDTRLGADTGRGGGGAAWLPWVLCALLAGSWALVAVRWYRAKPEEATPAAAAATFPGTAPAPKAAPAAGSVQLEVKGYLVPFRQIAVSPIDVAGRIIELNVVEGKLYEKDAVLAKIDPTSFLAQREEATAALTSAERRLTAAEARLAELKPESVRKVELEQLQAVLDEARAQRTQAAADLARITAASGSSSIQERQQARTNDVTSEARVKKLEADLDILKQGPRPEKIKAAEGDRAAAEAEVSAAKARLKQADWRLENCVIKAPIAGTVLTKKAEQGNLVNPLAFAASSGSVCDMADLADLEADLEIPERDIAKLKVGQPCRVRADAYPDKVYVGTLDRIMPIANRAKSIVNVRVKVKLPDGEVPGTFLKPEMGAVVSFLPAADGAK